VSIPPPPKVNPSAVFLQQTTILPRPARRGKPHEGKKEIQRRLKQLQRAKGG